MLICNVSLRPPRTAIAADLVEAITATDATATGNIVFATLVDDPASVGDIVNAYLGEIMLEAASASDTLEAGSSYVAVIDEAATAIAAQDSTAGAVPVTTTSIAGPLFVFDTTFTATSLTVINVGLR